MNRKELYQKINEMNLQSVIKKTYNKDYTKCSNLDLESIITKKSKSTKTKVVHKPINTINPSAFKELIEVLKQKGLLLKSEIERIMKF